MNSCAIYNDGKLGSSQIFIKQKTSKIKMGIWKKWITSPILMHNEKSNERFGPPKC